MPTDPQPTLSANPDDRLAFWSAVLFIAMLIAFAGTALLLSPETFAWLYEENGPIEVVSVLLWGAAAVYFARDAIRGGGLTPALGALLSLAAGMREADLHKAITGYSVLKISFYRSAEFPLSHRLFAGVIVAAIAVALIVLLALFLRSLLRNGWASRAMKWLLLAIVILVVSKVLDRAPATLQEDFGILLSEPVRRQFTAFEEGLEACLPLVFLLARWFSRGAPVRRA